MPKTISADDLQAVLDTASRFAAGGSLGQIRRAMKPKVPRRTLQRHLARLAAEEKLTVTGTGRGRLYHVLGGEKGNRRIKIETARSAPRTGGRHLSGDRKISGDRKSVPASPRYEMNEEYIRLSARSESIRRRIRAPIRDRRPVGFNRTFLDKYRPNSRHYIPAATRRRLRELGQSIDGERPAGTFARQIFNRLLIDLSWNSSRLEGNTYSLLETERLLEQGDAASGKKSEEAQMILNHKAAIELLVDQTADVGFNRFTVLNLHAMLSDNLLPDPRACGRLRIRAVGIAKTVYHPLEVPQVIEECFDQLLAKCAVIRDPIEQAFFAMVHIPYLQPFEDVNKRVSRLAANIPLIARNLCPLSFVDLPQRAYIDGILGVYELNKIDLLRDVFVWAYERSCARYSAIRQSLGEPDPFRMRYRAVIAEIIAAIVRDGVNKRIATARIRSRAATSTPKKDQARFVEVVETELQSLHEGNIARYRLRPAEYRKWMKNWR